MMRHDRNEPANERLTELRAEVEQWKDTTRLAMSALTTSRDVLHAASGLPEGIDDADVVDETVLALRPRAEAAEAEVERLRAEIRDRESERADLRDRVQKAEAQVARVEALADAREGHLTISQSLDGSQVLAGEWVRLVLLRAALEDPS